MKRASTFQLKMKISKNFSVLLTLYLIITYLASVFSVSSVANVFSNETRKFVQLWRARFFFAPVLCCFLEPATRNYKPATRPVLWQFNTGNRKPVTEFSSVKNQCKSVLRVERAKSRSIGMV
jgi:hypothetical protein